MALKNLPSMTRDEFAYLAHEEACPDCLGHEDAAAALAARVDIPALKRRLDEQRRKEAEEAKFKCDGGCTCQIGQGCRYYGG